MNKATTFILTTLILLLSGCSWQEYFVLHNNTGSDITVTYTTTKVNGFAIFDNMPSVYQSNNSGEIDWNKKIEVEDKDTSLPGYQFILPPNSILKFGTLSNDNYVKHDQEFINDRVFNLQIMEIMKKDGSVKITADQFDHFFKKKKGLIKYEIR